MGLFAYIARDPAGQRVTGVLASANEQMVLAELSARALSPVKINEVRERGRRARAIRTRHLAGAYRQLADLLRAGVPLLRALRLLSRGKANPHLAKVMGEVADAVADGARLADAMEQRAGVFPSIHIAMVRAGEMGGFLEQVLARLGDFLEHQADMKSKVVGNLIYPAVLVSLAGLVIVGALIWFVPKFESMFARLAELPLPTRLLMATSDLFTQHWLLVTLGLAGLAFLFRWLWGQAPVRRWWAGAQLRLPGLGPLVRGLSVARVTRFLGTMLGNGIPMLSAMKISRDAAGHVLLAESIDEATEAVRAGESLAKPLAASGMITEDVVEMISVGESANNLPEVLITIADTLEKRIDRMLTMLLRLMEPLLLLMLAGVVVFIFIALFLPMVQMSASIGS